MILVSCLWLKGNWNPFGFYCVILILNLSCLISQMHFWFPKFDTFEFQSLSPAFDLPNDTFDFQNLSGLISQITLLISKIYRVWFLKWHFWFPKFDFSNNTFDFQNETDMDDIHVTVLWVVSLTHGKVRATPSQLLHYDRRRQRECFSENRGCAPDRV